MFIKTKTLILKTRQTRTNKFLLTTYTSRFGKILYSVRGLNKMQAKLKSALLPFVYTEIISVKTKGGPVVTRANFIKDLFPKNSFEDQILAFYFADLTDAITPQGVKDKQVFTLLVKTFSFLAQNQKNYLDYLVLLILFPWNLIKYLGYSPNLESCGYCSRIIQQNAFLSYKYGLLCSQCKKYDKKAVQLNHQEINFLKALSQRNIIFPERYPFLNQSSLKKIALFINLYTFYTIGISPSSFKLIKSFFLR